MKPEDKDALHHLRKLSAGNTTRRFDHYLYFPAEDIANRVATVLRERGVTADVRLGADESNWLVLARTLTDSSDDATEFIFNMMYHIADEFGGEYDGWEADVPGEAAD